VIALVGALQLLDAKQSNYEFSVRPRWELSSLAATASAAPSL
jgi:hypothetical protein